MGEGLKVAMMQVEFMHCETHYYMLDEIDDIINRLIKTRKILKKKMTCIL